MHDHACMDRCAIQDASCISCKILHETCKIFFLGITQFMIMKLNQTGKVIKVSCTYMHIHARIFSKNHVRFLQGHSRPFVRAKHDSHKIMHDYAQPFVRTMHGSHKILS